MPERKLFRQLGRPDFKPAIALLENGLAVDRTNAPIKERDGDIVEARGDRREAESIKAAIRFLGKGK